MVVTVSSSCEAEPTWFGGYGSRVGATHLAGWLSGLALGLWQRCRTPHKNRTWPVHGLCRSSSEVRRLRLADLADHHHDTRV